jgi:uncharacterized protein (TIGR03435 family)
VSGFSGGWIFVRRGSVGSLVVFLRQAAGRPVIDKTGLTGIYDIDLKWSPEPDQPLADAVGDIAGGVSLFTAVGEQLGLKLVPSDAVREVLQIVRIDRPTPD